MRKNTARIMKEVCKEYEQELYKTNPSNAQDFLQEVVECVQNLITQQPIYCMYCGMETTNESHVCDECQKVALELEHSRKKLICEVCPSCGTVINTTINEDARQVECPHCGLKEVYLCHECMDNIGTCDRNNKCAYCHGDTDMFEL